MWFTSRVSACRREFSSHEAASPQRSARVKRRGAFEATRRRSGATSGAHRASSQCPRCALKPVKPKEWVRPWLLKRAARFGHDP